MKKKILYLFSDTGGGHRASVNALRAAIQKLDPGVDQEMVDLFAQSSKFLNIFAKMYSPVIKYTPRLWGALWYLLDDLNKLKKLQKIATPFLDKELKKLITEKKPDVIVSVHPLMNHVTTQALKDLGLKIPVITVVTDPVTFHRSWVDENVDELVVATPEAQRRAVEFGMPRQKIKLLGLPIRPGFASKDEGGAKRAAQTSSTSKPFTVLMMGGGEGAGRMYDIIRALDDAGLGIRLIVIAGRNKRLEEKLKSEAGEFSFPITVYGFTEDVASLMAESDIIITKGGPGSIAEALAMNLPMIIMSWLPGQEEGNVQYVKDENVGRVSENPREIAAIVRELKTDKKEFEKIKENIQRVRKPHAALDIGKLILKYLGGKS